MCPVPSGAPPLSQDPWGRARPVEECSSFFSLEPRKRRRPDLPAQGSPMTHTLTCLVCLFILPILKQKMHYRAHEKTLHRTKDQTRKSTSRPTPGSSVTHTPPTPDFTTNSFLCATFQNVSVFMKSLTCDTGFVF